jgi:MFS family permease
MYSLFAATFCELTGLFMFAPWLLFRLKAAGLDDSLIGLVAASQWLGLGLATPLAAGWVARLGLRGALVASSAVPVLTLGLSVLSPWPLGWALLSLLGGMAGALRWIVAEATVAELAPPARRGRIVGLYETMVGVTFIVGPGLLAALGEGASHSSLPGWLAVGLAVMGLLLSLGVPPTHSPHHGAAGADAQALAHAHHGHVPGEPEAPHLGWRGIWQAMRAMPVLMAAGFVGGFFEAGTAGVLPLYGLAAGMGTTVAALLVSASGLGSALVMVPAGEAADRWSLRGVLLLCAGLNALATLVLLLVPGGVGLVCAVAFVWGGAGGALYTLAMVEIGHRLQGVRLVNTTAVLVLCYTLGGMLAPGLGGALLSWGGTRGLLAGMALVALAGWAALARSANEVGTKVNAG